MGFARFLITNWPLEELGSSWSHCNQLSLTYSQSHWRGEVDPLKILVKKLKLKMILSMLPLSQVEYLHPWQTHSAGELPQRPSLDRHQKRLGCEKRWELRKYIKKEKFKDMLSYSEGYFPILLVCMLSFWTTVWVPNQSTMKRGNKNRKKCSFLKKPKFFCQGLENNPRKRKKWKLAEKTFSHYFFFSLDFSRPT